MTQRHRGRKLMVKSRMEELCLKTFAKLSERRRQLSIITENIPDSRRRTTKSPRGHDSARQRLSEKTTRRRAKRPRRNIVNQQVGQVSRRVWLTDLVGYDSDFKANSALNRKPMQRTQQRRSTRSHRSPTDNASKSILCILLTMLCILK